MRRGCAEAKPMRPMTLSLAFMVFVRGLTRPAYTSTCHNIPELSGRYRSAPVVKELITLYLGLIELTIPLYWLRADKA